MDVCNLPPNSITLVESIENKPGPIGIFTTLYQRLLKV